MKKIFYLAIVFFAILLIQTKTFAKNIEENRAYFPPVIMYHDIRTEPLNFMDVTVENFARQLDFLQKDGWQTLSMDEFVKIIESKKIFPKKSVLITFDDGYQGIFKYAAPELEKRNMKATFFILPGALDKTSGDYPHITTEELKILSENPLFSIESHTITHPYLNQLNSEEQDKEIGESKKILEKITGKKVQAIAYPTGAYDKYVINKSYCGRI